MKPIRLQINHRTNPVGIDEKSFRFTWNARGGITQTAYRVRVWSDGDEAVFDSKKTASSSMNCTADFKISSRKRYFWSVTVWDENDSEGNSETAFFETGLFPDDWRARWITSGLVSDGERLPADCFKKDFELRGEVKKARLYATALGAYTADINGTRLSGVLAPGTTEYGQRLHYQTYDVTSLLKKQNRIAFTLTDGWYMGKLGYGNEHNRYGNQRKLVAQLEIEYADGSADTVITDKSFDYSNDGPVRYADLKDGEIYDSRLTPTYSKKAEETRYDVIPTASLTDGIYEAERFTPKLLISPTGKKILDFSQNLAGYVRFRIKGEYGQKIRLRLTETLDNCEYSRATILVEEGSPEILQEIVFICNGSEQSFQPEGFYSGFRYALVEGIDEINPKDFEAVATYSKLDFTGSFTCSNEKINKFHENTLWSMKSNFVDVPTDCPAREKSGWDGDAQVFSTTAAYLCDSASFFRKWLRDVRDCQHDDGRVLNVSPTPFPKSDMWEMHNAAGWGDAAVIIPYRLWKIYSDKSFITDNHDLILGWGNYTKKAAADKTEKQLALSEADNKNKPYYVPSSPLENYVIESGQHWGEWCEPDVDFLAEVHLPKPELTTAYAHYTMGLLSEMLREIGMDKEAAEFEEFSLKAKQAYNYYFVKDGHINAPRQAPMVRALALGLLEGETEKSVANDLNESAVKRNYTVGTGFLSTPFVLGVLTKYGYSDTAYRMLENTKAPGWLAMVEGGATTIWENYIMYDENNHPLSHSMNHYSPGAVSAFLYDTVCGIRINGENSFLLKPQPGGTLTFARAEYNSPFGKITSTWEKKDGKTVFSFEIPSNTTAQLILPNGETKQLLSGKHTITC
ncbi:MAG: glycoside hydrolase family 78 protein [Eubacterium sp.]|nr:glycoside hydrolase family 78 protein [Eubacterium sp.]